MKPTTGDGNVANGCAFRPNVYAFCNVHTHVIATLSLGLCVPADTTGKLRKVPPLAHLALA